MFIRNLVENSKDHSTKAIKNLNHFETQRNNVLC